MYGTFWFIHLFKHQIHRLIHKSESSPGHKSKTEEVNQFHKIHHAALSACTSADNSLTALIKYQVRLSESTVFTPVDEVFTHSGNIFSNSCAITPICIPSFSTTADSTTSSNSGLSLIISSFVLYSKFLTCIELSASKQTLLSIPIYSLEHALKKS